MNKIRELRKKNGLTIAELAKKVGCHPNIIWRVEAGEVEAGKIQAERLIKIADVLHTHPRNLL